MVTPVSSVTVATVPLAAMSSKGLVVVETK
jgi:hypothetical protein